MPAYNAEAFIGRAIESLLSQTLKDFELIVSDNASTDGTGAICEKYAKKDRRVRFIRQRINIGAPRNWNTVAHAARGEFFKWASASDYWAPRMLEMCVRAMENDPGIALCYGMTQFVDANEKPIEIYHNDRSFAEERPSKRFAGVASFLALNHAQCGVCRLKLLRCTRLDRLYPSGDLALMAELALYGRFVLLPDVLTFRRQSRDTFTSMLTPLELQRIYDPDAKRPMKLVMFRRHIDNLVSISRAPIPMVEKFSAYRFALRLARWDRGRLSRELVSLFTLSRTIA